MPTSWISQLQAILTGDQFFTDPVFCTSYSYDNGRHHAMPAAVAFPTHATQVQAIVGVCMEHRIPITPRGRGTGTPGGAVPTPNGLVVSFERMDQILEFQPGSRYMKVEPGVLNQSVQDLARSKNLFWAADPSSQAFCSIGGNLGYNAGGPHTLKYGATKDNVFYIEAVTGTGELIKTGFPVSKSSSGYDLTRLLIGSEGTLALFTQACLKLTPEPQARTLLQAWFTDELDACRTVEMLMNQPITPAALEFMDSNCLALLKQHSTLTIPTEAQALLLIELDGIAEELPAHVNSLQKKLTLAFCHQELSNPAQAWAARKALSPILRQLAPYKVNEDVVVPVHQLHQFLQTLKKITAEMAILNVNFGHAGNGNLHVNLLFPDKSDRHQKQAKAGLEKIFSTVISLGGTLSGEHGIGLDKKPFIAQAYSTETLALMKALKQQFDPYNILNPDKLL